MSVAYNTYLTEHKNNVKKAWEILKGIPSIMTILTTTEKEQAGTYIDAHDASKYDAQEYNAYDSHFYGSKEKMTAEEKKILEKEYDKAWLMHLHRNPHHWQYWLLRNDDGSSRALDMSKEYIMEMICDWMSFSIKQNDLNEVQKWYKTNSPNMQLSLQTKSIVEYILKELDRTVNQ